MTRVRGSASSIILAVPAPQGEQSEELDEPGIELKWPVAQDVQVEAPSASAYVPSVQSMHWSAPASLAFPAAHAKQSEDLEDPSVALWLPAAHGVHEVALSTMLA